MKTCTTCLQELPFECFGREAKGKFGLKSKCKECLKQYSKSYYATSESRKNYYKKYKLENKALIKKTMDFWVKNNPDKIKAKDERYRKANRQKRNEITKQFLAQNPQYPGEWRKKNPDKVKANRIRRRARVRSAKTFLVSEKDIKKLLSKPCAYCNKQSEHLDHVIPLAKGGDHSIGNLIGACSKCNASKSDKFITRWKYKKKGN